MAKSSIPGILMLLGLTGCAASGPKYGEQITASTAQATNDAHVVVFRTGEDMQYLARSAAVKIDGMKVGGCDYKGYKRFDVAPGTHVITVETWDMAGSCKLKVDTSAGADYFFEIKPRSGSFYGLMALGVVGQAIESSGKECGGAFSIEPVDKAQALPRVAELRLSD